MNVFSKKQVVIFPDSLSTKYIDFRCDDEGKIHINNHGSVNYDEFNKVLPVPELTFSFMEGSSEVEPVLANYVLPKIKEELKLSSRDDITLVVPARYNCSNIISLLRNQSISGERIDIAAVVPRKLECLLTHDVDEWLIAGDFLHEDAERDNYITSVLLKEGFHNFRKAFIKNSLRFVSVQPEQSCLENLLKEYLTSDANKAKNISVINIGEEAVTAAVFRDGALCMQRILTCGTESKFIKTLMAQTAVSYQEARKVLYEGVIFLADSLAEQNKVKNYNLIKPIFGELIKELYNFYDSFLAKFREFNINEMILCGPASTIPNIGITIESHLNIPLKRLSEIIADTIIMTDHEISNEIIDCFASALAAVYPNKLDYMQSRITPVTYSDNVFAIFLNRSIISLNEWSEKRRKRNELLKRQESEAKKQLKHPGYILIQDADAGTLVHTCTGYKLKGKFYRLKGGSGPNNAAICEINAAEISRIYCSDDITKVEPQQFLLQEPSQDKSRKIYHK